MKQFLILLFLMLTSVEISIAQDYCSNPTEEIKGDTLTFLKDRFEVHKADFIGKPAKIVFQEFQKYLPIKFVSENATSIFIDPEGKSYLDGVSIYFHDLEFVKQQRIVTRLSVDFEDTHIEFYDYRHSLPDGIQDAQILPYLGNYIVKDLRVFVIDRKK